MYSRVLEIQYTEKTATKTDAVLEKPQQLVALGLVCQLPAGTTSVRESGTEAQVGWWVQPRERGGSCAVRPAQGLPQPRQPEPSRQQQQNAARGEKGAPLPLRGVFGLCLFRGVFFLFFCKLRR